MNNLLREVLQHGQEFLPGNALQIRLGLLGLILNKNLLIEDVPGMGKTTLVKYLAKISGLDFKRIQFTNDLLPSDILGISIFNKDTETFTFRPGPVFGELILADELNRGTPKTQSALLQVMEEKKISVDGATYDLPGNFSIFATQNPRGQYGTYPLPESQLDRFLFKFSMAKLNREDEIFLLKSGSRRDQLDSLKPFISNNDLFIWAKEIKEVIVSDVIYEYISEILQASRSIEDASGLSPRAGLDIIEAAKGQAFLENRNHVLPDDVQGVFPFVAGHRMYSYQSLNSHHENTKAREFLRKVSFVKI